MTVRGRLERRDLEGGSWVLVTAKQQYTLVGTVPAELKGQTIEVEGDEDAGFGIFMQGPQLRVTAVRKTQA